MALIPDEFRQIFYLLLLLLIKLLKGIEYFNADISEILVLKSIQFRLTVPPLYRNKIKV